MYKLLAIAVLVAFLSNGVDSFRVPRQAESEEKDSGILSRVTNTVHSYWDFTLKKATDWVETVKSWELNERAKTLYDDTSSALKTYANILQDQVYHHIVPQ